MRALYPLCESLEYGRTIVESVIDHRVSYHEGAVSKHLIHMKLERNWIKPFKRVE